MKLLLVIIAFVVLSACTHSSVKTVCEGTPIVVTQGGGGCWKSTCGPYGDSWLCNVTYSEVVGTQPAPSPAPSSAYYNSGGQLVVDLLGKQKSGDLLDPHIGDTQFSTCDLSPKCPVNKTTVAVPVPFGGSPSPSPKVEL